jgi:uncharacterized paraquat-inducible protein A
MSPSERKCQFCGATSDLYEISEAYTFVCGRCWNSIAAIVRRILQSLAAQTAEELNKPFTEE